VRSSSRAQSDRSRRGAEGPHEDDDFRKHLHGGEQLTSTGPTKVTVSAPPQEIEAFESLELWILPGHISRWVTPAQLFEYQTANEIFGEGRVVICALTSRYAESGSLDNMVSDFYSKSPNLDRQRKVSRFRGNHMRSSIARALRH
jgi:hypothetical protein